MVDALQQRYGWTDEYIEGLAFEVFDQKVQLVLKKHRQQIEIEERRFRIGLFTVHRAVSFAFWANREIPQSKADYIKAKKKKGPSDNDWREIEQERSQMTRFNESHGISLTHPWEFEELFGLGHGFFPKPETDPRNSLRKHRITDKQELRNMRERIIGKLETIRDTHGNIPLHDGPAKLSRD